MSLISIIVPVYNVEKYLNQCLDSIINQTYNELDIILIDDGSTDNSGKICDDYALLDSRVRVFHQSNQGLSAARNLGLNNIYGDYVGFVDSDDFIHLQMYEILYKDLIRNNAQISSCSLTRLNNNKNINFYKRISQLSETSVMTNIVNLENLLLCSPTSGHTVWNRLYKSTLFDNIRFPINRLYEDAYTTYKVVFLSKVVTYRQEKLYFYRQHKDSIMARNFSLQSMDKIVAANEIIEFIRTDCPNLIEHAECFKIISSLKVMSDLLKSDINKYKVIYDDLYRYLINIDMSNNKLLSKRHRCLIYIFRKNKKMFSLIWSIRNYL